LGIERDTFFDFGMKRDMLHILTWWWRGVIFVALVVEKDTCFDLGLERDTILTCW